MVSVADIRERVRQRLDRYLGKPCPEAILKEVCLLLVLLADGDIEWLVQRDPPEKWEDTRMHLIEVQAEYREEVELIRQFPDNWATKTQQHGCPPEAARQEARKRFLLDYKLAAALPPIVPGVRYRFREIRERIEQKLEISGTTDENSLLTVCQVLVQLAFDRSGLSLRLMSTNPVHWGPEMEGALDRIQHQYADELELLYQEVGRVVCATFHLSDRAVQRLLTRRLNREFMGKRR